jgi:hypothetical protein
MHDFWRFAENYSTDFGRVDPLYADVTERLVNKRGGGANACRVRAADLAAELRKAREQTP